MKFLPLLGTWIVLFPIAVWPSALNPAAKDNQTNTNHAHQIAKEPSSLADDPEYPDPQQNPTIQTSNSEVKTVTITQRSPNDVWYKTYVIATIVLAIIGIVGVCVALKTLSAIARQSSIMEKTLVLTQRPRVKIRNLVIEPTAAASDTTSLEAYFDIVNIGGTAAEVIESHSMVWTGFGDHVPVQRPFDSVPGNNPIAAGTKIQAGEIKRGYFVVPKISINIAHHTTANPHYAESQSLRIIGFVKYRDGLGICRETVFNRRYDPTQSRTLVVNDPDYEYAD